MIKGALWQPVSGWMGSPPQVVVEIASEETWKRDLDEEPRLYGLMGVEEYVAYDLHQPMLSASQGMRLHGWRRSKTGQQLRKLPWYPDGSLWSPQLASFLVPDGSMLRLYDRQGNLRLTRAEAEAEAKMIALRLVEVEAEAKQVALQRAEAEAEAKAAALRLAEVEARRADTEAEAKRAAIRRAEILAEKLRSLGIDPSQL